MAFDHSVPFGQIEAVIIDTFPELLPPDGGGLWDPEQVRRQAFDAVSNPAEGGKLPLMIYELGDSIPSDYGIANDSQEADMTFYYVTKEALTNLAVRAKGEALKSALVAGSYTGLTFLHKSGESNDFNPIVEFFLSRFVPYTAGCFRMRVVYGESWYS